MSKLKPIKKKIVKTYLKQGGDSLSKAVRTVQPELTKKSSHNKAHRMLSSASFWQEVNDLSVELGFGVNDAMAILIKKAKAGDKDSLRALENWFRITGNETPSKQQIDTTIKEGELSAEEKMSIHAEVLKSVHSRN